MDERRRSGTRQETGQLRHTTWSGVCLVITNQAVHALVTPRFAYFGLSGES